MKARFRNERKDLIRVFAFLPIVALVGDRKTHSILIQWIWYAVNVDF